MGDNCDGAKVRRQEQFHLDCAKRFCKVERVNCVEINKCVCVCAYKNVVEILIFFFFFFFVNVEMYSAGAPQWTRFRVNVVGSYATSAAVLVSQAADYEVRVNGATARGARLAIDGSSLPVVVDAAESLSTMASQAVIGEREMIISVIFCSRERERDLMFLCNFLYRFVAIARFCVASAVALHKSIGIVGAKRRRRRRQKEKLYVCCD